jgi:hypothetical protein
MKCQIFFISLIGLMPCLKINAAKYCNYKKFQGKIILTKKQAIAIAVEHTNKTIYKNLEKGVLLRPLIGKCLVDYAEILSKPRKFKGLGFAIPFEKYFTPDPGIATFEGRIYWEISFLATAVEKDHYIMHGESYVLIDAITGEVVFTLHRNY